MSLFAPAGKALSEKEVARERKARLRRLLDECAPDVAWVVSFTRMRAWVEDANHPEDVGTVQPLVMSIHERPGSGAKERYLWSTMCSHPDMVFPFELVQAEVEGQALKYGHFPGVLHFNELCYVAPFRQAYPGLTVGLAPAPLPAELQEGLVRIEVEAKRARPCQRSWPPLAASSPALLPHHMAAHVAASNALTACAPWEHGVTESQVFRVRFPGGATLADRYALPPGEVYWVNIVGQKLVMELQMIMQQARAEGKGNVNINLNIPEPHSVFGAYVFRRRCDAETKVMNANAQDLIRGMQRGIKPRFPFHPQDLPFPATPNDLDRQCAVCGAPKAAPCSVCGEVSYCAAAAQGTISSCAAAHKEAHDPVCSARKKRGPVLEAPLSHMQCPVLQCALAHQTALPGEDLELVAAGGRPIAGRIGHLFKGQEAPLPLLHDGKGSKTRPPLLELARLTRAMSAVAAFVHDHRWLASCPVPMEHEVPVPLPSLPGMGEHFGEGVGGMGGVAWVRTDPLFAPPERPLRQENMDRSMEHLQRVMGAQLEGMEGVNCPQARQDVERRRQEAMRQMAASGGGGGGGHGHSH